MDSKAYVRLNLVCSGGVGRIGPDPDRTKTSVSLCSTQDQLETLVEIICSLSSRPVKTSQLSELVFLSHHCILPLSLL